jgi:hypothetical protein
VWGCCPRGCGRDEGGGVIGPLWNLVDDQYCDGQFAEFGFGVTIVTNTWDTCTLKLYDKYLVYRCFVSRAIGS